LVTNTISRSKTEKYSNCKQEMGGIWVKLPTLLLKSLNPKTTGSKGEGILLGALPLKKGDISEQCLKIWARFTGQFVCPNLPHVCTCGIHFKYDYGVRLYPITQE
jgi:hypothetical protein